jgi:hypothetical protein
VVVPLLGKVKNEHGERYHLTPLCSITSSGLQVELWVRRLVEAQATFRRYQGPAFCTRSGTPACIADYELEILDRLHLIQQRQPDLIPPDVQIFEEYGLSRSFRRGSTSEARSRNVQENDINLINRWRTFETAKGLHPRLPWGTTTRISVFSSPPFSATPRLFSWGGRRTHTSTTSTTYRGGESCFVF